MKEKSAKTSFAIHEVVVLSGFSKYMLDYLAREEIFEASLPLPHDRGRGRRRQYTYQDVVLLRALHAICAGRGKVRNLSKSLSAFRKEFGPIYPGQRLARHLVVQGNELCVVNSDGAMRQLRDGQLTLSLVVDLADIRNEIDGKVEYNAHSQGFSLRPEVAAEAEAERAKIWQPIARRRLASVR